MSRKRWNKKPIAQERQLTTSHRLQLEFLNLRILQPLHELQVERELNWMQSSTLDEYGFLSTVS